jgi:aspartyl-tRNA(Asn)/glutamyl-tRNA(Gln) amidotransferase subunit A
MNIAFASLKELRERLTRKEFSSRELLKFFINRFKTHDTQLGSALEIFDEESIVTLTYHHGDLQGLPGLIKDNICQQGRITSCSSKILANYRASYDATCVSRLKDVGAYLIGRANCDEFAMGSSTETSVFQKTHNPWDMTRVPGGSGGGSAAAVAAGLVPWALGTDTGGSVRQPAAFCGIVGLKPTYGLVSRYGLVAYGSSLDQVGVNTRTVYDSAFILSHIAGTDPKDATTLSVHKKDYTATLHGSLKSGLKIGVIQNALYADGMDQEIIKAIEAVIETYKKMGATIQPITLPTFDYAAAVYFIVSRAEAASNLARFDGVRYGYRSPESSSLSELYNNTRHEGFGEEVRGRILIGNYVLSAGYAAEYYEKALKVRAHMRQEMSKAFTDIDVMLLPVCAMSAFKHGAFDDNKLQMDLQDYFTAPANLTGLPALAIPCGFTVSSLPMSFQLIGPSQSEELLLQTAYAYEQRTPWHTMHPPAFVH